MVPQQVSFVERSSLSQRVPYRRFHCSTDVQVICLAEFVLWTQITGCHDYDYQESFTPQQNDTRPRLNVNCLSIPGELCVHKFCMRNVNGNSVKFSEWYSLLVTRNNLTIGCSVCSLLLAK